MGGKRISFADRQRLEVLIKSSAKITTIARELGLHRDTVYKELRRGMMPEDYAAHNFQKYSALVGQCGLMSEYQKAQGQLETNKGKNEKPDLQMSLKV